jgi:predicted NBD/HSP70 family sugar kinase
MEKNLTITAAEMRGINRSAVLETIRLRGPIARTQIANILQVSLPTVIRVVDELIAEDLVKLTGDKEWSGGRKRPLLEFNSQGHVIIGVDMNESRLYGAVADLAGNILTETFLSHQTRGVDSYEFLIEIIEKLLVFTQGTGKNIRGIGVGAPGITYYEQGIVHWAPTLEWRDFPLKEKLSERFHLPVVLDNDVNLSALGELWFGVGQGSSNLVLVTMGSGIGAGIIIDGGVYRGSHLTAGEIGFLLPDRSLLGGKREGYGALEELTSGTSIAEKARKILDGQIPEEQRLALTAEDVFNAYWRNEAWAKPIVLDSIDYLAQMVAALSVCFDPDCIVLSGSMGKSSDLLIDQILARIDGVIPLNPKLVVSTLGHRAAAMGTIAEILYNTSDFYQVRKLA